MDIFQRSMMLRCFAVPETVMLLLGNGETESRTSFPGTGFSLSATHDALDSAPSGVTGALVGERA